MLYDRVMGKVRLEWKEEVKSKPKLRTYKTFKSDFGTEKYMLFNWESSERSYLAWLKCGKLHLRIETGRYVNEKLEYCLCQICNSWEMNFLYDCTC